jgi:SPP1 gp7 family putative phage head morphogenesis protein
VTRRVLSARERAAKRFRADLLRQESTTMAALAKSYRTSLAVIDRQLAKLTQQIEDAARAGLPVSSSWLWQEQRLQSLHTQAMMQLAKAGAQAANLIEQAQLDAIAAASDGADAMIRAAYANGPATIQPDVLAARIPTAIVERVVAAVQPKTPLQTLIASISADNAQAALDHLTTGVTLGENPRKIAAKMRAELGNTQWQAERIARTEVIRAANLASLDRYNDSPLVEGWEWLAADGCCIACLAMQGTQHDLSETLDSHPNCRCCMVPIVTSWSDLGYTGIADDEALATGEELLADMSDEDIAAAYGPGVADALTSGRATLQDFVTTKTDPNWGPMKVRVPLKTVLAKAG